MLLAAHSEVRIVEPTTTVIPLSPSTVIAILLTLIVCALLAAAIVWWLQARGRRARERLLAQQRVHQEEALGRVLQSVSQDHDETVADCERRLADVQGRADALERDNARLRDRLSSSGMLGLFGGKQRDVVSALLLENEQLHELLASQQAKMGLMVRDMSDRWVAQIAEQASESARAVRYKQALLSAFLQREETRTLLDRMLTEGKVEPEPPEEPGERQ
jgi:type II secretory pathway pseudopilin PulG